MIPAAMPGASSGGHCAGGGLRLSEDVCVCTPASGLLCVHIGVEVEREECGVIAAKISCRAQSASRDVGT